MDSKSCLYLLVVLISAILIVLPTTMGMTEKESNCDKTIRTGFIDVLKLIRDKPDLNPLVTPLAEPCEKCALYGLGEIVLHGPCPSKNNDNCKSIDHDITIIIPSVKQVCECELHTNPVEMMKQIQSSSAKNNNYGKSCSSDMLQQQQGNTVKTPKTLKIDEILKFDECASLLPVTIPTASKIPTSFGAATSTLKENAKTPPEKVKGTIVVELLNAQIELGFRLNMATKEMKPYKGQLGRNNTDEIVVTCVNSEKIDGVDPFQGPCQCLKKVNHIKEVFTNFMDTVFTCYSDIWTKQSKTGETAAGMEEAANGMLNEMSCKEFYCD